MSDIKIGDWVTMRPAGKPNALGLTGCKVLEFGQTDDGKQAAKLDAGIFGIIGALVADLTVEPRP